MYGKTRASCPLLVVAVVIVTVLLHVAAPVRASEHGRDEHYGVVVDAGSTATRARVYSWMVGTPELSIEHSGDYEVDIMLGDFVDDPVGLVEFLLDLINGTKQLLDEDLHGETPLYFMATGGVRDLDSDAAVALLAMVNELLQNASINPFSLAMASIISGNEEAFYAWSAGNYLAGLFKTNPAADVGVVELGGSSVQISFVSPTFLQMNKVIAAIQKHHYNLFVTSYLTFGQEATVEKIRQRILRNNPGMANISDPCALNGDESQTLEENGQSYQVLGTGDVSRCREILNDLLMTVADDACIAKPCGLAGVYLPPIPDNAVFYAISAFKYSMRTIGAIADDGTINLQDVKPKAEQYCAKTYSQVAQETDRSDQYMSADCTMALYIPILLEQGLGFNPNVTVNVNGEIRDKDIEWTMGAILYHEAQKPADPIKPKPCDNPAASNNSHRRTHPTLLMTVMCLMMLRLIERSL